MRWLLLLVLLTAQVQAASGLRRAGRIDQPSVLKNQNGDLILTTIPADEKGNTTSAGARTEIDAFGKLRVSEPFTLFDSKELHQAESVYWTQSTSGAGAAITFDSNFASNTLTAGTAAGGFASYQTRTYWPYSPGKSQLIYMTGNFMGAQAGVIKRMGYFDDRNGMFVQVSGTALGVGLRTYTSGSAVDSVTTQSSFNLDPLDGSGPSGYNVDLTKAQIWIIDFEWLGVGHVRYGVWADNKAVYFHEITNTNRYTGVYMQRPNLPVRYEIRNGTNSGTAYSMSKICTTVISEGGTGRYSQSVARTGSAVNANGTLVSVPLVAVRVKSSFSRGANIRPHFFSMASTTGANAYPLLCLNCQVSGGTWVSITNTAIEYNNSMTAWTTTNTAAVMIGSDIISSGARATGGQHVDPFLWGNFDYDQTTQDVWTLGVENVSGNNNYIGVLGIEEGR